MCVSERERERESEREREQKRGTRDVYNTQLTSLLNLCLGTV